MRGGFGCSGRHRRGGAARRPWRPIATSRVQLPGRAGASILRHRRRPARGERRSSRGGAGPRLGPGWRSRHRRESGLARSSALRRGGFRPARIPAIARRAGRRAPRMGVATSHDGPIWKTRRIARRVAAILPRRAPEERADRPARDRDAPAPDGAPKQTPRPGGHRADERPRSAGGSRDVGVRIRARGATRPVRWPAIRAQCREGEAGTEAGPACVRGSRRARPPTRGRARGGRWGAALSAPPGQCPPAYPGRNDGRGADRGLSERRLAGRDARRQAPPDPGAASPSPPPGRIRRRWAS